VHNPATLIFGEVTDLQSGIDMLSEVKESVRPDRSLLEVA